jgi:isopenicillin-N N-acyltransferase-like protein
MSVAYLRLDGEPFAAGYRHGAALATRLRAFLGDGLARLNHLLPRPTPLAELAPTLDRYAAEIARQTPELAEEINGLADGAGIGRREAVLLQVRREILGYSRIPTAGDCTTYALAGPDHRGEPVLAQTVDLSGNLDDQLAVLDVGRPGAPRRSLVLSLGGLLGYLGVNSDGLAVGLNLVLAGDWRPGLPPYLAIRHLLDAAGSVAQALEILGGLRLASSRSLTLCDPGRRVTVEIVGDGVWRVAADQVVHTNHLLHPELAARDELNVFARNSSRLRRDAALRGLSTMEPDAGVEEHFALLSEPPIRVADTGDIRRERTVATVVVLPARGELHLRPGDPARSATERFALAGSAVRT